MVSANTTEDTGDNPATTEVETDFALEATRDDKPAVDANRDVIVKGEFYYLGFNDLFDNWFVSAQQPPEGEGRITVRPGTPKFRVGLAHGDGDLNPGDADFENYRITIEDSSGDLLGYQAETVSSDRTYDSNKIVFGEGTAVTALLDNVEDAGAAAAKNLTNIRLSNRVTDGVAVSPYHSRSLGETNPAGDASGLSYGNVGLVDADANLFPLVNILYADAPVEIL